MILRWAAVVVVIFLGAGLILYFAAAPGRISRNELAERIAKCHPTWQSYEEDLKAQLGAAPTAEWDGQPESAHYHDRSLTVEVSMTGPWIEYQLAAPILVKDASGAVLQLTSMELAGDRAVYRFSLGASTGGTSLAWIDVKYPRGQRRLIPSISPGE